MFARNFLNTILRNNNSLLLTRFLLKQQIPSRFQTTHFVVKHDPRQQIIFVDIDDHRAFVSYQQRGQVLILLKTIVPKELGGKGIGKVLARETFKYVKDNDLKMKIKCDFLQNYLDKYGEEYQRYVRK